MSFSVNHLFPQAAMLPDGTAATSDTSELTITSAGVSNKGIKREVNEDAFSILEKAGYQVFLVADGLGGPKRGAVASNLALSSVRIALKEFSTFDNPSILGDAVVRANKDVFEKASASKTLHGMGTTLTGLVIANNHIFTAHVGNSRIYKISHGKIAQLTDDHTVVEELRREGIEPSPDLDLRPKSHLLTRSLGVKPTLDVEVISHPAVVQAGDIFLLCTDGLHDLVSNEEMAALVMAHPIKDAAHLLINLANERGGHDNITAVLMQVGKREIRSGGQVAVAPNGSSLTEEAPSARTARRSAPLKGRIREERGADRVSRPVRVAVPGRELLDLRERDDEGEVVSVRTAKAGRKRLKPPAPAASSSGGRGAQRLPPSAALGSAPLSRRLPPLTQRIEERKQEKEVGSGAAAGGLLRAKLGSNRGEDAAESSSAAGSGGPVAIELTPQATPGSKPSASKATSISTPKPQLLASAPASRVKVRTQDILGIGLGLALVGGFVITRMISTTSTKGGIRKEVAKIPAKDDRAADRYSVKENEDRELDADRENLIDPVGPEASGVEQDPSADPSDVSETNASIRPPRRRDEPDALREVREDSVSRIKDTMLRSMVLDVIEAIQHAVRDVEEKLDYLEDDDRERGERLKRMIDISKEASSMRTPTAVAGSKKGTSGEQALKKSTSQGDSTSKQPESLEEKKRRLIQNLPDADPFAGE